MRRVQSGQSGEPMIDPLAEQLGGAPFKYFGDWTDRIAKGELPHTKPPRPQGVERNIVVTTGMGRPKAVSARPDRVRPALSDGQRLRPALSARRNTRPTSCRSSTRRRTPSRASRRRCATRTCREALGPGHAATASRLTPSAYWGDEKIWDTQRQQPQRDVRQERAASGSRRRCAARTTRPSARRAPTILRPSRSRSSARPPARGARSEDDEVQVRRYLLQTHHLQFGYDANDTLWTSGGGPVVGWVNTKMFDETGDAAKAQGWTPFVLDTNGNGKRDDYVEPDSRSIRPRTSASSPASTP